MIDLLGASTESTVRVFICFFLGLALGAACASVLISKVRHPWRLVAGVEFGVAFFCIPIAALPFWTKWVWPALGPEGLVSCLGPLVKTGLSLLLLLPPAFLMGMTLPVIVAAVCVTGAGLQREAVRLYALNTLGGVIGLTVVTGFGIQHLGVPGSMVLLIGVNVLVAIQCYRRSLLEPRRQVEVPASRGGGAAVGESQPFRLAVALAVFSGAGVMAVEVLALHLVNLSLPTSFYPPATVLFCVILLLAVAAWLVPGAIQRLGPAQSLLPPSLAAAGFAVTLMPLILLSFGTARTADLAYSTTFMGFLGKTAGIALISLGPAVVFCGFTFPLAVCLCSGAGMAAGRKLGLLLAVNGIGGVAGAELARLVLVPLLGVHVAIGVVGASYALAAIAAGVWVKRKRLLAYAVPLVGLVATLVLTLRWLTALPLFYWGNAYTVLEVRSGYEGVLTVFEREGFGRGLSFNNQYLLGGSGSADDEQRQSHIPLLLHPSPDRVCYAGLGTGITASGSLKHAAVKSITAVELSGMVVDAAAKHFGDFNGHIDQEANVVIYVEDARTYIAACRDRFDVIVGDLFTPWRPGEAGLASLEYFRASKAALRSGGVFCQWFPMHQLTEYEFGIIQSTFRTVFAHAYAFRNHLKTGNIPMALVGFKDSMLDWETVKWRCTVEREAGRLTDPLRRHVEGVAMLYFGELDGFPPTGPLNTLANLRVELDAGLNLVVGKPGTLYSYASDGNPYADFVKSRRSAWPADRSVPDDYRRFLEVGFLVSRLEVAYDVNHPATAKLEAELRAQFPASVLSDAGADWSLWAGNRATLDCLRPSTPAKTGQR